MASVPARRAATVVLLRDGPRPEALLVARNPAGRVLGGVWAFPGGVVEALDGDGEVGLRAAAVRELEEETGIGGVDPAALVPWARWITPVSYPHRFDAYFFIAGAPAGCEPAVDGVELVAARWLTPDDALGAGLPLPFPTRTELGRLRAFASVADALATPPDGAFEPVQPRLRRPGDKSEPMLPGEAGYEAATG
jgi:8-oxo-dGTP pyrophosphatase MutT (NUDIX family)